MHFVPGEVQGGKHLPDTSDARHLGEHNSGKKIKNGSINFSHENICLRVSNRVHQHWVVGALIYRKTVGSANSNLMSRASFCNFSFLGGILVNNTKWNSKNNVSVPKDNSKHILKKSLQISIYNTWLLCRHSS